MQQETQFLRGVDEPEKSRSQKKRESTALQERGEALCKLDPNALKKMNLAPELLEAVLAWKKMPGNESKRRQMQYIGRLMRELDA